MKGGRIVVASSKHTDPLKYYIENSIISVLSHESLYGIILKLKYVGPPKKCPYKSIGENDESPLDQIILKLAIITDHSETRLTDLVTDEMKHTNKLGMSENLFYKEIRKQFKLVKDTIQMYEPICPTIIDWKIESYKQPTKDIFRKTVSRIRNAITSPIFDSIRHRADTQTEGTYTPLLRNIMNWIDSMKIYDIKIGTIAMELMEKYDTLYSTIKSNDTMKKQYINYAVYELIRLGSLGYVHGDTHLNNILINPSDIYFNENYKGRAMLIDFGRTEKTGQYIKTQCTKILSGVKSMDINIIIKELITYFVYSYYKDFIDIRLLTQLIAARNSTIEKHIQDPDYIRNANDYIREYNITVNNRIRSWKDAFLFKTAPLLRVKYTRKHRSLSPSPTINYTNPMNLTKKDKTRSIKVSRSLEKPNTDSPLKTIHL
jgi:tRNA A-37 threonylcarbamoyl transferase component Bud32